MKNRVSRFITRKINVVLLAVSALVLVSANFLPSVTQWVMADAFQDQINSLNSANSDARATVDGLQATAASYQDAINQLQAQINGIQSSIDANEAQQATLQQQIVDAQNQINQEKAYLASDVKQMYVDGTPSTLEMLATSKDLSSFVDKQEYRTSVQNSFARHAHQDCRPPKRSADQKNCR